MKRTLLTVLFCTLVLHLSAQVEIQVQSNGKKYSSVLLNGGTPDKFDIVFIGDGFTKENQPLFNEKVNEALAALQQTPPYSQHMQSFNIWKVNVLSAEPGIDHPSTGIVKNTALDCTFGNPANGSAERCITSASPDKCITAANYAPAYDAIIVLVNEKDPGGCASGMVFCTISEGFAAVITHELGHTIGGLADEYTCYVCNGSDNNRRYVYTEPSEVNITTNITLSTLKWKNLVQQHTPIPTMNDIPAGVVGCFEGGYYHATGIFRPQFKCHMRSTDAPFCAVCSRQIGMILQNNYY